MYIVQEIALRRVADMPPCLARDIARGILFEGGLRFTRNEIINHAGQEVGRHGPNGLGEYVFSEQFDASPDGQWGWKDNGLTIAKDGTVRAFTSGLHYIIVSPEGDILETDPHYGEPECGFWQGTTITDGQ